MRSRWLDAGYRRAFQLAYPCARFLRRYLHHNAVMVAVRVDDRVLAVLHSYKPGWVLPGGGLNSGEDYLTAAIRELREEVGVSIAATDLTLVWRRPRRRANGWTNFYEVRMSCEPKVTIDQREIIGAKFVPESDVAHFFR